MCRQLLIAGEGPCVGTWVSQTWCHQQAVLTEPWRLGCAASDQVHGHCYQQLVSRYQCTCTCQVFIGAGLACWWERWTHNQKVAGSNPGRSSKIFFSRVYFVCWLIFGVCSIPVLPQWHIIDPSHSAQSAGGRLHLNMRTPLTPWSQSGLTMPLSRHSLGTYQEMRSHVTCQGTFSRSPLSSPSPCGLILA